MSVWDVLGKIADSVDKAYQKEQEKINRAREKVAQQSARMSDKALIDSYKSTSNRYYKLAYEEELKRRGCPITKYKG